MRSGLPSPLRRVRAPLALLLFIALALSGCIAEGDPDDVVPETPAADDCVSDKVCGSDALLGDGGRDLRTDLLITDALPAPTWVVGDVFEQHLYYGEADGNGEHIVTMVVDDAGDCYQFGTTNQEAARKEATFDLPILGCIGKDDLATTAFDTSWDWMYDFPLQDGKSWSGSVTQIFNWNSNTFHDYAFTLEASYAEKIDTPNGFFPGFLVTGTTEDGATVLEYNYVPAIGWFSHFWFYDLATEEDDDIMFHAMNMGRSTNYTGEYYISDSQTLIDEAAVVCPIPGCIQGAPQIDFTVEEHVTYLMGVVVPIACTGHAVTNLVSPQERRDYEHQYLGDPTTCQGTSTSVGYSVYWIDEAAEAGTWHIATAGAAFAWGHYAWLEAITEHQYTLES